MNNDKTDNIAFSNWDAIDKALLDATKEGKLEEVEELLSGGAFINVQDENGWTPLMHSASAQNVKLTQLLMNNGADTELRGKNGEKAIYLSKTGPAMGVIFNGLKERYKKRALAKEQSKQNQSNTSEL